MTPLSAESSGEVIELPQEFASPADEKFIVESYKDLRLRCLQQEPESFSSTYEDESQFSEETWVQRVKNPSAKTFIAVRTGPEDDPNAHPITKLSREWIGLCVLIGPEPLDPDKSDPEAAIAAFVQSMANSKGETELNGSPLSYCAVSMFVSPDYRRHGFARKLIDAVIEGARKNVGELSAPKAYLTIFFEVENDRARHLYGKWGFTMMSDIGEFPDKKGNPRPMGWGYILL